MNTIPVIAGNSKNILVLGSGFVSRPAIEVLSDAGYKITIACRTLEKAKKQAEGVSNTTAKALNVEDDISLDREVARNALVISLLPYTHHVLVILSAIKHKKHVVTTSYVSPAMMNLDREAKEAGIIVLNEVGLDPGIDHLYAMKTINEVHNAGARIIKFFSYCGGLPAPEYSDNPLGYKFSWSARGALLALKNSAKYYDEDELIEVSSKDLMNVAKPYFIYPGYAFVAYPNRDSSVYRERYSIPEARTIIRGTLRYDVFTKFITCLNEIGLLDENERDDFKKQQEPIAWKVLISRLLGLSSTAERDLIEAASSKAGLTPGEEEEGRIVAGLRDLGLFSDETVVPQGTPLDTLCDLLEQRCSYEAGERDMVVLQHKFEIETKDGHRELRTSTLIEYGDPKGHAAMARLVGVPCAVAAHQILHGKISQIGIVVPMLADIYESLRTELEEKYNIFLKEKIIS